MTKQAPKVFISYSHDTPEHKRWVLDLATRLVNAGVDANIDAWSLEPGDDLPHFMETQLSQSDRVIMVCTENYVNKANKGAGGVGYEKMIVTSALMRNIDDNKVIPIIRQEGSNLTPTFLTSKLYLDFSNDDEFEAVIDDLVRAIHGEPLFKKPELGNNPFKPASQTPTVKNHDISSDILKTIIAIYEGGRDAIEDKLVYNHLNLSRIVFEIHAKQLHEQGFVNYSQGWVFVTDKAKIHAVQQGWIK
ncbi:TPA: toll/interleukin-1 receptor domain-containing protein [Vibrio parahaemolyticus]|uniref:toll/interleukin-1 receptor domain-containing protein n=1 Tax=Vibrio TaxID=662 RepID=UPI0005435BBD|nr:MULTISPECIES: toll/interleukin-1 receptor domain-containing protein [Vibrio]APC87767.1 hypothetical protein FORC22_1906 [Vibrio parahaemolyticus]EGR2892513.1 TIR domain-containing protein [Vibrio parahaemolyticus]EGR2932004.1 TIR domain-containing protein [Vibrio parahaemolyticus]EGR2958410.1 TIR domain-containing protein [Vibrio parahaemolyticus]EGR2962967.1 TIR domain-containing protein [Vibrio parahaemolyticus]